MNHSQHRLTTAPGIDGRPEAIAFFGVAPKLVDALIELVVGSDLEPARWAVFHDEAAALWPLVGKWQQVIDVFVTILPSRSPAMVEPSLFILENEGIELGKIAWIHGLGGNDCGPIDEVRYVVACVEGNPTATMHELSLLVRGPGSNGRIASHL